MDRHRQSTAREVGQADVSTMIANDGSGDGHAEADASCLFIAGFLQPHKRLKNPFKILLRNSRTAILNHNLKFRVFNDSLIMIDYANTRRREGHHAFEAICQAGIRRFRPIQLTTLPTFGGLGPMIFETSRQARFMIPMAISLGFGILFATAIMLVLIPCLYLVAEDVLGLFTVTVKSPSPEKVSNEPEAIASE